MWFILQMSYGLCDIYFFSLYFSLQSFTNVKTKTSPSPVGHSLLTSVLSALLLFLLHTVPFFVSHMSTCYYMTFVKLLWQWNPRGRDCIASVLGVSPASSGHWHIASASPVLVRETHGCCRHILVLVFVHIWPCTVFTWLRPFWAGSFTTYFFPTWQMTQRSTSLCICVFVCSAGYFLGIDLKKRNHEVQGA